MQFQLQAMISQLEPRSLLPYADTLIRSHVLNCIL
jgi:hypothetical protein